jgi:hypothetical protein
MGGGGPEYAEKALLLAEHGLPGINLLLQGQAGLEIAQAQEPFAAGGQGLFYFPQRMKMC